MNYNICLLRLNLYFYTAYPSEARDLIANYYEKYHCVISAHCFGQASASKKVEKQPSPENKNTLCFPLQKDDVYSLYSYIIDLRDEKVRRKYAGLFAKN